MNRAPHTPSRTPAPVPDKYGKMWVVIRAGGDRHPIDREPDEGIDEWARGQDVTVLEYTLTRVIRGRPKGVVAPPSKGGSR